MTCVIQYTVRKYSLLQSALINKYKTIKYAETEGEHF